MVTTTGVVHRPLFRTVFRQHGYFFRESAILTIAMGFCLHLYRVVFGDEATLEHVLTPTTDIFLMIPMTYAAVTGILSYRRMVFANRMHRMALTAAIGYITLSVPLHLCVTLVMHDVSFYVHMAGYWFSYLLLIVVYPVFLTMLSKLKFEE